MSAALCPILRPGEESRAPKCRLAPFYRNRSYGDSEEWAAYAFLDNDTPILALMEEGRWGCTIVYKLKGSWHWGWEWYAYCNPNALHPGVQLGCNTCNDDRQYP